MVDMESQQDGSVAKSELAPLVKLSSVAPSLPTSPVRQENQNNNHINGSVPTLQDGKVKKTSNVLEVPELEVKFLDKDSIMSSSRSSLEEEEDEKNQPKIPDGGWGWVVVFSSFILSMIMDGVSFSFGLLYIEFLHEFGASKSSTSWIGSLFLSVPLTTGPIMSALVDRYGCRKMTMFGGIVSAIGFIMSAYANSVGTLYITFGIIAGIGLGLCYVTAVVSIAYWFDKRRNLAVGLGACGTGVGTFVYAPMTQYFINEFGWRGTTLFLAGTFLNMCVCGALMRDPDWLKEQNGHGSLGSKSSKKSTSTTSVSGKSMPEDFPDVDEVRKLLKNGQTNEYQLQSLMMSLKTPAMDTQPKEHYRSDVNLPTFVKQNERVPLEVLEQLSSNKRLYNVILENYPSLLACRSTSDKGLNKIVEDVTAITARVPVTFSMKLKKADKIRPKSIVHQQSLPEQTVHDPLILQRKASLHQPSSPPDTSAWFKRAFATQNHNYFMNIRLHKNSVMYRGAMLNIRRYRLRASSCPNIYRNSMTTLAKENQDKWYSEGLDLLKGMMDFSMFSELHFMLMSLSTILLFTWFVVPYFYLADHMSRHNYNEGDASVILSIIGITNTIGMVVLGWAGDQPWMNVIKVFSTCITLCGISCIAMLYFTENFIMLATSAGFFGLFFASSFVFTPVVIVELVPLERFTVAYGLILLCQGIGNLVGPPLAGLMFDITQTWDQSFIQAGIWIVVSGVLLMFIPYTKNRKLWGSGPLEKDTASERCSMA